MDVFEAYLECLKEKGKVDVKISSIVELSNRVDREYPLTAQLAGYALKQYHLKKKKSHGTMVIVYDADLLRKAIAKHDQEATWYDRMQAALGEDVATTGNPPPEDDETPPEAINSSVDNTNSDERANATHVARPSASQLEGTAAAVLSGSTSSPDQVCEVCGRPLEDSEVFFGFGGRILCASDFGATAGQEAPARG